MHGNGRDVVRGGWGIYQDMGYTNANVLFAASDATGKGFGTVLNVDNQSGIRNPDGSFYKVGQPIVQHCQPEPGGHELGAAVRPVVTDPRLQMPYTRQTAFGWSHQLMPSTVVTVDYVRNDGRDLNTRPRINTRRSRHPCGRRLAFLNLQPNASGYARAASSYGKSQYDAMIVGLKRRMLKGLDFTGTYTLANAKSTIGTAVDELNADNLQDATLLYDDPKVFGPNSRTDARHHGHDGGGPAVEGVHRRADLAVPVGACRWRSPRASTRTRTANATTFPRRPTRLTASATHRKEIGECKTWNCGRGARARR